MKDRLEKFIQENRQDFDMHTPSDAVWAKIQTNIAGEKKRSLPWRRIVWNAAAVILIFFSSYVVLEYVHYKNDPLNPGLAIRNNEQLAPLVEAEVYYTAQVNNKLAEVEELIQKYPDIADELRNDLLQIDSMNADLKKDLKDNIANEEIVESLIQNYRIKLEILEEMLRQLDAQNTDNNDEKIDGYEL